MSVAVLFPGQGSQTAGFLHRLPPVAAVHEVLDEASSVLGLDVLTLDTDVALSSTVATQLSLLIAGAAFWGYLDSEAVSVSVVAGMSVGLFSAALAAGSISLGTALRLVQRRAELMQERFPGGTHGLAAVQGLRHAEVNVILEGSELLVANVNSPTQLVIAGPVRALESFLHLAALSGASKAVLLNAAVPSHIPALASSAQRLLQLAKTLPVSAPDRTILSNGNARPITTAEGMREALAFNMARPVQWHDTMGVIHGLGVTLCVESPPGHALTSLSLEISSGMRAFSAAETRWDLLLREIRADRDA